MNIKIRESFDFLEEIQKELLELEECFYQDKPYNPKNRYAVKLEQQYKDKIIDLTNLLEEITNHLLVISKILSNSKYDELILKDFRIRTLKILDGIDYEEK